jgi:chromosome segregation ATPase
MPRIE